MNELPDRNRLPGEPESRRHLTILFVDLSDSTQLSGVLEAEVYAALLDEVRSIFSQVVTVHGGTVNQFQGDGLQALFGYPAASEHDGRHAAEAALEIHERVRALRAGYATTGAAQVSVHTGIHTGLTLARQGDAVSARVELFGPAPGIAKHLSDLAQADEILVSDATLGPGSRFFRLDEPRLLTVKGSSEPLAVHRVLERTAVRTRFEANVQRGLIPFIGRQAQLARLDGVLGDVMAGHTRFVTIAAPPGVGKTRLAEEFLRRAATGRCSVLRGYCEAGLRAEPLQPIVQMLRARLLPPAGTASAEEIGSRLAGIDPALPVHLPELLKALSIQSDAEGASVAQPVGAPRLVAALRKLFAALARERPHILFIDDWHWADDLTRQVVQAIHELRELPILLLATTRPLEPGDAPLTSADIVELSPFDDDEANATIGSLLPDADPFATEVIRRYAGGNPLFIEELCHSVASDGLRTGPLAVRGGSAWLEALIASRCARLTRQQREVLNAAAVVGNVVPTWLLENLTGWREHDPLIIGLARHDLLFPGETPGTLRFKHGITRDVVYGTVGLQERRTLHRRTAGLLAARADPGAEQEACESLAYHLAGAEDHAHAARYAEMAGDKAMAASSIDRARAQYRAALDMLERVPPSPALYQAWRSIVRRLGVVTVYDPSRADLALFERAIARAQQHEDAAGAAYARYWLAYIGYALGETRTAVRACEAALRAADALGDPRLAAQVRATLGQALAAAAEYPRALELLRGAVRDGLAAGTADRPSAGVAYSLACMASVHGDQGRFEVAHDCFRQALEALPGAGHEVKASVLCWRSAVYLWQGRREAARDDALEARRIAMRVKSFYLFAMSLGLHAYAQWTLAPGPRPLRDMADAAAWLQGRDKSLFISLHHGWLAAAAAQQGRRSDARRHAAQALQRARRHDWIGAAMACRAVASLALADGDWPLAERQLALADRVASVRGSPHEAACNQVLRARLALARGARGAALADLDAAAAAFERLQMHEQRDEALRLRESA